MSFFFWLVVVLAVASAASLIGLSVVGWVVHVREARKQRRAWRVKR